VLQESITCYESTLIQALGLDVHAINQFVDSFVKPSLYSQGGWLQVMVY